MAVNIDGDGLIALDGTSSTQGRLRLAEDSDNGTNYIELTAPASVGSDRTITFPDATTTVVGTDATQTLTNKTLGSGLVMGASTITSATAQASTSGTSIDFTGIPSWAKRITVMFSGVSTSGTSLPAIQLGDSGGIETTGYDAGSALFSPTGIGTSLFTTSFTIRTDAIAIGTLSGSITFSLLSDSTNSWSASGVVVCPTPGAYMSAVSGIKSLSATLDRIRITTVNGSDTFDAGTINILFE